MNALGGAEEKATYRRNKATRRKKSVPRDKGPNQDSSSPAQGEQSDRPADVNIAVHPSFPASATTALLAETIHALTAIGGHDNPPARHIVGHEGVASVKEKLKTVSEELEDFLEVSCAVDISREDELEFSTSYPHNLEQRAEQASDPEA